MTHGSLFSGIGGFDLAAEWMGWDNLFHCEWNEFGKRVLNYYWPQAISYGDITKTDFTIWRGRIDVLTGGFPCQPYSKAGKRLGKEEERHLWPEMLRAIREIQPTYIVGENVPGLINWNGGLVFDEVQADLEAEGYKVTPFILPACGVNAPHRRDRIWFIAYTESRRKRGLRNESQKTWTSKSDQPPGGVCGILHASNTDGLRLRGQSNGTGESGQLNKESKKYDWSNFPTQSPVCDGNDGISSRLDGITFSKWRNESIKAGGNAIVPQVAYQIFKAIQEYENLHFNTNNRP